MYVKCVVNSQWIVVSYRLMPRPPIRKRCGIVPGPIYVISASDNIASCPPIRKRCGIAFVSKADNVQGMASQDAVQRDLASRHARLLCILISASDNVQGIG